MGPRTVVIFIICLVSVRANQNNLNNFLFSGIYEFIDLTHPFDNNTVYWTDTQNFVFTKKTAEQGDSGSWYAANEFAAGEHGGTHIDAPYHFLQKGLQVGDLPLDNLIVPLIIADVSSKVNNNPNFVLHKHDLDHLLSYNMRQPCVVIFKFGWSQYFVDRKKYLGMSDDNVDKNFPGLSEELVQWLTSSYKNIVGIGVDTASLDPGYSTDYPVHKIMAQSGLYNLENVKLNTHVPEYGCTALVLPMKIAQGTGAPLRLVAICPKKISGK